MSKRTYQVRATYAVTLTVSADSLTDAVHLIGEDGEFHVSIGDYEGYGNTVKVHGVWELDSEEPSV